MFHDDDFYGLSPEQLRRFRLTVLHPDDSRHLLTAEEVADFIAAEILPQVRADCFLGAMFVDDLASPLGWSQPYLGYLGNHRVDPAAFLIPGMLLRAEGMILFHVRGPKTPRPTRRDVRVAKRVLKAGELARIRLIDYLVLGAGSWLSLDDAGRVRFPPLGGPSPRDGRAEVKPKYRNPERPSETWSGRGKMARWLSEKLEAGAELEDFAVGK